MQMQDIISVDNNIFFYKIANTSTNITIMATPIPIVIFHSIEIPTVILNNNIAILLWIIFSAMVWQKNKWIVHVHDSCRDIANKARLADKQQKLNFIVLYLSV